MSDEMPEVLMLDDLAKVLRCSTVTIRRRLREGGNLPSRLPSVDDRHRWARVTVEEWLKRPGGLWKSGTRRFA